MPAIFCEPDCTCSRHCVGERGYQTEWPSQKAVHTRIRNYRGSAKEQECIDCGLPARDWSWDQVGDYRDIFNYDPRCRSCHLKFDPVRVKPCQKDCTCMKHEKSGNHGNTNATRWGKVEL